MGSTRCVVLFAGVIVGTTACVECRPPKADAVSPSRSLGADIAPMPSSTDVRILVEMRVDLLVSQRGGRAGVKLPALVTPETGSWNVMIPLEGPADAIRELSTEILTGLRNDAVRVQPVLEGQGQPIAYVRLMSTRRALNLPARLRLPVEISGLPHGIRHRPCSIVVLLQPLEQQ